MFSGAVGLGFGFDCVPGMGAVVFFKRDAMACETHRANIAARAFDGDVAGKLLPFYSKI